MSEFACKNGHIMGSGQRICHCGARLYTMDGLTAWQLRKMEELQEAEEWATEEEGEEDDDNQRK
ncbi:unnamed protein product [marine sediment metagenome]|uniref:Uncharacterized protein n=1 Tax=marine sediment metagenome TaxID=412755 RepID=X1D6W6_9ZZZZ